MELITKISLSVFHWFVDSLNDFKYGSYFNNTITQIEYILEIIEKAIVLLAPVA